VIKDERLGTADQVRAALSPTVLPVFDHLRNVIAQADPQSTETASVREKALYFTLGRGKMTDGYAYIMGHGSHVNLGFFHGIDLPDPEGLLEGTGKKLRHVKVRTMADVDAASLRNLIDAAIEHIVSRKGRP
jgi:hypothetical protein